MIDNHQRFFQILLHRNRDRRYVCDREGRREKEKRLCMCVVHGPISSRHRIQCGCTLFSCTFATDDLSLCATDVYMRHFASWACVGESLHDTSHSTFNELLCSIHTCVSQTQLLLLFLLSFSLSYVVNDADFCLPPHTLCPLHMCAHILFIIYSLLPCIKWAKPKHTSYDSIWEFVVLLYINMFIIYVLLLHFSSMMDVSRADIDAEFYA